MTELIPVENARVVAIEPDNQFKNPRLVFQIDDPLSEDDETVQRDIILWSTDYQTKELSEKSIANMEKNLKIATGNDDVTFNGQATGEGNHISNWIEANPNAELKEIYQNEKGYQIGSSTGGGSSVDLGDSKYLKLWKESEGAYDPQKHRVMIKDALPQDTREAINNQDTNHDDVFKTRNGALKFSVSDQVIVDVVLMDANGFEQEHKEATLIGIVDEIIENFTNRNEVGKLKVEDLEAFRKGMDEAPQKHGYRAFLKLVGGTNGILLPKASSSLLKAVLPEATRKTIAFNVMVPQTGMVYRSSPMRAPQDTTKDWVPNFFEYVNADDVVRADISGFLAQTELPAYQETAKNALDEVLDGSIKNLADPESDKHDTVASNVLAFLRYFFVGRSITVGGKIQTDMNLGSYITKFGTYSDADVDNYEQVYQSFVNGSFESEDEVVEPAPEPQAAPADPLAEPDETPAPAGAQDDAEESPFAGHEASQPEAEEKVEAAEPFNEKGRNPFER